MRQANTIAQSPGDVLVVDDALANLRLLINLLSVQGYNVRPAQSWRIGACCCQSIVARYYSVRYKYARHGRV